MAAIYELSYKPEGGTETNFLLGTSIGGSLNFYLYNNFSDDSVDLSFRGRKTTLDSKTLTQIKSSGGVSITASSGDITTSSSGDITATSKNYKIDATNLNLNLTGSISYGSQITSTYSGKTLDFKFTKGDESSDAAVFSLTYQNYKTSLKTSFGGNTYNHFLTTKGPLYITSESQYVYFGQRASGSTTNSPVVRVDQSAEKLEVYHPTPTGWKAVMDESYMDDLYIYRVIVRLDYNYSLNGVFMSTVAYDDSWDLTAGTTQMTSFLEDFLTSHPLLYNNGTRAPFGVAYSKLNNSIQYRSFSSGEIEKIDMAQGFPYVNLIYGGRLLKI